MTKQSEIDMLDHTIEVLGPDSYLGPWLVEIRHELDMTAPTARFTAGDLVEARDVATGQWRQARIERVAPYRGREGYDVLWVLPADAPMWLSRGGWQMGSCVREVQR